MITTKIIIYQSFIPPLKIETSFIQQQYVNSQKALKNLKKIDIKISDTLSSLMEIKPLVKLTPKIKKYWLENKSYYREEVYYKFVITIYFENKVFENIESEYGINSNEFYLQYILPSVLEKRFYDFLMVLNISRVGGYHYGLGIMESKSKLKVLKKLSFYSKELYEYSLEKKWPKFKNLEILKTWDWYLFKVNPKGIDEISSTNLGRALNAFSYLYENAEEVNALFWTMVGIESLYVKGKEGIAEQIKQKGQLYLGKIEEFKKRLSQMYDFRSAFIHGNKDFPSYFHTHDGMDSYTKFNTEFYEILLTAQSMLLATIQKMAKENRSELDFHYSLK